MPVIAKSLDSDRVSSDDTRRLITTATLKLLAYCQLREWAGFDPYDALNSRIFKFFPFLDSRVPRLAMTQVLKRSPVNLRPLLLVPPTQNPKALALFLSSWLRLSKLGLVNDNGQVVKLTERLVDLRSPNSPDFCWGYSFPWQTRTLIVPRGTPNLVCTTFVADALLDCYETTGEHRYLEMAASGARYILKNLFWTDGGSVAGLAYPLPSMRLNVHNANLLGSALFCRVAKHTADRELVEAALKVARYSASRQRPDGSWPYGEHPTQRWIDNFHTGYNLCALRSIGKSLSTSEFEGIVQRGFSFYRSHFFREDGAPRYFHDRTYPIDIHCVAQSIITLAVFKDLEAENLELGCSTTRWAMQQMWSEQGFFYYRILRSCKIRTSYMRWSQAWMLAALSTLLCALSENPLNQAQSI